MHLIVWPHKPQCIRILFCIPVKKIINPTFTKIKRVHLVVTYNIRTKFKLIRMHRLNAIVFTHIHAHTHTCSHHHKNSINKFRRPQSVCKCFKILKSNVFTIIVISLHSVSSESQNCKVTNNADLSNEIIISIVLSLIFFLSECKCTVCKSSVVKTLIFLLKEMSLCEL